MKIRTVVLVVALVGLLVSYGYAAEIGREAAAVARDHVAGVTASHPGWAEIGYALYVD